MGWYCRWQGVRNTWHIYTRVKILYLRGKKQKEGENAAECIQLRGFGTFYQSKEICPVLLPKSVHR